MLFRTNCKRKCLGFILLLHISATILYILLFTQKEFASTNAERNCLTGNIVTVREGGRLGNSIWEYVSVLSVGEALDIPQYVPKRILDRLSKVFKNIRIPAYEDSLLSDQCRKTNGGDFEKCKTKTLSRNGTAWDRLCYQLTYGNWIAPNTARKPVAELKKLKDSWKLPSIVILPKWMTLPHVFDTVGITRFKEEFQFRDDIKQLAEQTMHGVRKKVKSSDLIFVGVHVRRTDYPKFMKKYHGKNVALADLDYYQRAMNKMHDMYSGSKMVFIVVGDDYEWCKNNLVNEQEGVFWGSLEHSAFIDNWEEKTNVGAYHDLAVLSMQNHTIIGYGTFAITGSLLSGGHTIVCNISRYGKTPNNFATLMSNKLPNWEQL